NARLMNITPQIRLRTLYSDVVMTEIEIVQLLSHETGEYQVKIRMIYRMLLNTETDFGFAILRQVSLNESAVVSPISVIFTLAMLQAGAKGKSKTQIDEVIAKGASDDSITQHFSNLSSEILNAKNGVQTRIANGFFMNKQFNLKTDYKERIVDNYHAKVEALDFTQAEKTSKARF
ncbi:hypothetical protein KIN20_013619, partial [Parelaphostrongylus tenuis]